MARRRGEIGVVGMACAFGACPDLAAFEQALYAGAPLRESENAPKPSIELVDGDLLRRALGRSKGDVRVGVIVCVSPLSLEQGRAVGTLAEALGRGSAGPRCVLGQGEVGEAVVTAGTWLGDGAADLVLVVSEDELGVGAIFLAPLNAVAEGQVLAVIEAVGPGGEASSQDVAADALTQGGVNLNEIGYLETLTWPPPALAVGRNVVEDLTCAVGSHTSVFGQASPMAALIKAVLALYRRTLFASGRLQPSDLPPDWEASPFYVLPQSRPWFAEQPGAERVAAVALKIGHHLQYLTLSESPAPTLPSQVRPNLTGQTAYLIPIAGCDRDELLARLVRCRRAIEEGIDLSEVMNEAVAAYESGDNQPYTLVIVGHDRAEVLKDMVHAADGIDHAFEEGHDWQTPRGSAFTAAPLGSDGIAFVYPGVFNSYLGLGRDLFQHFPGLHEQLGEVTSDLNSTVASRSLYPRSRWSWTDEEAARWEAALAADPLALIESGAAFAIAHTAILRDVFGVEPDVALGYSLGEVSMLWAAGVWTDADQGSARLHDSPLFRSRVAGPREAIREHWGLPPGAAVPWKTYVLKAPLAEVRRQVGREPRVYLLLINLEDEVVIAGEEVGCLRVIESLRCHALPVPLEIAIHNEAIASEYDAFVRLYTHPVDQRPKTLFYSAADYGPLSLDTRSLAHAMAKMSCQPVDFPRLIKGVYDQGARIFVELGPLATCTRRIKRILRAKPHAAVALNPSRGDDLGGILGAMALLVTHRVPVRLEHLRRREPRIGAHPVRFLRKGTGASQTITLSAADSTTNINEASLNLYERYVLSQGGRAARAHRTFLSTRAKAQEQARFLLELQIDAAQGALTQMTVQSTARLPLSSSPDPSTSERHLTATVAGRSPALTHTPTRTEPQFTKRDLVAFAKGDPAQCFGPDFAPYRHRHLPRIPNGELLLMDRVIRVEGEPWALDGNAALRSEYDVAQGAWFYEGGLYPGLPPHTALMEMALQPCGFLSAYLRSPLLGPPGDLHFRNLDGEGRLLADLDLRGKTVTNDVRLISSVRGQGVILQTFTFVLSCEGVPFYEGESSFGYFPPEALARQGGLGGEVNGSLKRWLTPASVTVSLHVASLPLRLQLMRDLQVASDGGRYGLGYCQGAGRLSPADWFFRAHFYQDPVMPGSLGVEAAVQALSAYGRWRHPELGIPSVHQVIDHATTWRYRGQMTPRDRDWAADVHIREVREEAGELTLLGDAGFWKADARIYAIEDLAVRLVSS